MDISTAQDYPSEPPADPSSCSGDQQVAEGHQADDGASAEVQNTAIPSSLNADPQSLEDSEPPYENCSDKFDDADTPPLNTDLPNPPADSDSVAKSVPEASEASSAAPSKRPVTRAKLYRLNKQQGAAADAEDGSEELMWVDMGTGVPYVKDIVDAPLGRNIVLLFSSIVKEQTPDGEVKRKFKTTLQLTEPPQQQNSQVIGFRALWESSQLEGTDTSSGDDPLALSFHSEDGCATFMEILGNAVLQPEEETGKRRQSIGPKRPIWAGGADPPSRPQEEPTRLEPPKPKIIDLVPPQNVEEVASTAYVVSLVTMPLLQGLLLLGHKLQATLQDAEATPRSSVPSSPSEVGSGRFGEPLFEPSTGMLLSDRDMLLASKEHFVRTFQQPDFFDALRQRYEEASSQSDTDTLGHLATIVRGMLTVATPTLLRDFLYVDGDMQPTRRGPGGMLMPIAPAQDASSRSSGRQKPSLADIFERDLKEGEDLTESEKPDPPPSSPTGVFVDVLKMIQHDPSVLPEKRMNHVERFFGSEGIWESLARELAHEPASQSLRTALARYRRLQYIVDCVVPTALDDVGLMYYRNAVMQTTVDVLTEMLGISRRDFDTTEKKEDFARVLQEPCPASLKRLLDHWTLGIWDLSERIDRASRRESDDVSVPRFLAALIHSTQTQQLFPALEIRKGRRLLCDRLLAFAPDEGMPTGLLSLLITLRDELHHTLTHPDANVDILTFAVDIIRFVNEMGSVAMRDHFMREITHYARPDADNPPLPELLDPQPGSPTTFLTICMSVICNAPPHVPFAAVEAMELVVPSFTSTLMCTEAEATQMMEVMFTHETHAVLPRVLLLGLHAESQDCCFQATCRVLQGLFEEKDLVFFAKKLLLRPDVQSVVSAAVKRELMGHTSSTCGAAITLNQQALIRVLKTVAAIEDQELSQFLIEVRCTEAIIHLLLSCLTPGPPPPLGCPEYHRKYRCLTPLASICLEFLYDLIEYSGTTIQAALLLPTTPGTCLSGPFMRAPEAISLDMGFSVADSLQRFLMSTGQPSALPPIVETLLQHLLVLQKPPVERQSASSIVEDQYSVNGQPPPSIAATDGPPARRLSLSPRGTMISPPSETKNPSPRARFLPRLPGSRGNDDDFDETDHWLESEDDIDLLHGDLSSPAKRCRTDLNSGLFGDEPAPPPLVLDLPAAAATFRLSSNADDRWPGNRPLKEQSEGGGPERKRSIAEVNSEEEYPAKAMNAPRDSPTEKETD